MNTRRLGGALAAVSLAAFLGGPAPGARAADKKDSYYYYGPGGLSEHWHDPDNKDAEAQRLGRDTWIHWTWGNQKLLRKASVLAGNLPVPVSIDFFRVLDSRKRATRFREFGLINEPNCEASLRPDKYGLYLDHFKGDPYGYYPVSDADRKAHPDSYPAANGKAVGHYPRRYSRVDEKGQRRSEDLRHYGRPTGVVGLRLFDNPAFDARKWDVGEYFRNPGRVEPPYLVGFSCAFCHIAFAPNKPPADPENPRWENLAANLGNQYFREGELMFGKGRILFGDKHPDPAAPGDPYATRGLTEGDFLYHYAVTQQPGTSETSRISYDFINNPNTMNPIFGLKYRPKFTETTPWGTPRPKQVMRVLKDGSDSLGIEWALMRVPINVGCEGDYWIDHLFDPASGHRQRPFRIAEVLAGLSPDERKEVRAAGGPPLDAESEIPPAPADASPQEQAARDAKVRARQAQLDARQKENQRRYRSPYGAGEQFGQDWQDAWRRVPSLAAYLSSYKPFRLKDTPAGNAALSKDEATLRRGAEVFGTHCARCHSSKQPQFARTPRQRARYFQEKSTGAWPDVQKFFLEGNFLSDDERYPVTELGTNMARALATNAVDGDIWAEFSSRDYKALPPLGPLTLDVPVFPPDPRLPWSLRRPIRVEFDPPGGGRGYYRTPSLISLWATAPYLHNNSVGDYWVIKNGKRERFPNTGARVGERLPDGTWVDYPIDTSIQGRLAMFQDGMDKLLNPARRHHWVKRTSADSTLVPDLSGSARQLVAGVARDALRREVRAWLSENQVPPAQIELALGAVGPSLDRAVGDVLTDGGASLRFAWAAAHLRLRDHADRLFELTFDDLKGALGEKLGGQAVPLDRLKLSVRREFLARLDRLDRDVRSAAMLKVPAGTPVNLYANLNPNALIHAALAHMRLHDDPRALAEALLRLSDCPDLVEDSGHLYGSDLSDRDKGALIEFLKTF
jgi:hypothetical protein